MSDDELEAILLSHFLGKRVTKLRFIQRLDLVQGLLESGDHWKNSTNDNELDAIF